MFSHSHNKRQTEWLTCLCNFEMPRKCIVEGCRSGYKTTKEEKAAGLGKYIKNTVFGFPNELDLSCRWKRFAKKTDEKPSTSTDDEKPSVQTNGICINHFEEKYIKRGNGRNELEYDMLPIPTIHTSSKILAKPSLQPNILVPRKPPTKRPYKHPLLDETPAFIHKARSSFCT